MKKSLISGTVEFLFTELQTGLTFAKIAISSASDPAKIERNKKNARKAYDALLKFQARILLSKAERRQFSVGFAQLKKDLLKLGEHV